LASPANCDLCYASIEAGEGFAFYSGVRIMGVLTGSMLVCPGCTERLAAGQPVGGGEGSPVDPANLAVVANAHGIVQCWRRLGLGPGAARREGRALAEAYWKDPKSGLPAIQAFWTGAGRGPATSPPTPAAPPATRVAPPTPVEPPRPPVAAVAPEDSSGMGIAAVAPEEIKRWSWGAFGLNWIWGLGNGTWIALLALVPYAGLIVAVVLGVKGNEWAWRNKRWESLAHFQRVQRTWGRWAIALLVAIVAVTLAATVANVLLHR
jgi:hypothetical protein